MSLAPGTRLGHYEIRGSIGVGGMGEVYRAVDTRLGRVVAIKILPEHLASNPTMRERFEREARAISSLNHPKICTLHDVGEAGNVHYLVLEHLEGETLAERIRHGPIPAREALRIAAEIAEALDAAHRRSLAHRDLKPGNIMLSSAGLKLLDFGLARALQPPLTVDASQAATAAGPVTTAGAIVGTLQYMAPEQVEGREADARADIFALGLVLYEMLTSRRAFEGATASALTASILRDDPPPLPESLPAARRIERCLRRCLARDRDERWQSARDLMHELRWLAQEPAEVDADDLAGAPARLGWLPLLIAPLGLAAGLGLGWMVFRAPAVGVPEPLNVDLALPEGTQLNGWASPVVALAPDGRALAFVADGQDGVARLYVRRLDASATQQVPGSETAEGPFFSPDGKWVGFAVGVSLRSGRAGELLKYSLETGLTQPICPLADYFGADWGRDGDILFNETTTGGLRKIAASGGQPRTVRATFRDDGDDVSRWLVFPALLPDGRHVLLTDWVGTFSRIVIVDLESGEISDPGIRGERAFFAGDRLLYTDHEGTLFEVPFDARERMPTGPPVARMDGISQTRANLPVLDIADDGTMVYTRGFVRGSRIVPSQLVHVAASGAETVLPFDPQLIYRDIALSPTGNRLVVPLRDHSLWIHDLGRGTRVRLPRGRVVEPFALAWSPDGQSVSFSASLGGDRLALFRQRASGTEEPRAVLEEAAVELYAGSWTRDGRRLVYVRNDSAQETGFSIRILNLDAPAEPSIVVEGLASILRASLSPDGRWMAFDSAEGGDFEVYVHDMSGASDRVVVSPDGGSYPRWSPDGRTLYYHAPGRVMAVEAPSSRDSRFGPPRQVVETDIEPSFAVDPAGGFYGFRPVPGVGVQTHLKLSLSRIRQGD